MKSSTLKTNLTLKVGQNKLKILLKKEQISTSNWKSIWTFKLIKKN